MAPPPTSTMANGSSQPAATTSRARPQARRKLNVTADDAAYHGVLPGSAGTKRAAVEKPEGEPRVKRKRVEASGTAGASGVATSGGRKAADKGQEVERKCLVSGCFVAVNSFKRVTERVVCPMSDGPNQVDFTKLPLEALYRYLIEYDIVPDLDPLPTTAYDPPPPSSLLKPRAQRGSTASPAPQLPPTPANRPRRELSASTSRRRSSRLLDDDRRPSVTPVLADVGEVHRTLAQIAERHFREHQIKNLDVLGTFTYAVKAKGKPSVPSVCSSQTNSLSRARSDMLSGMADDYLLFHHPRAHCHSLRSDMLPTPFHSAWMLTSLITARMRG